MQAISVELPLAKYDFMSDLLETEKERDQGDEGGEVYCIIVCMENIQQKTGFIACYVKTASGLILDKQKRRAS